MKSKRDSESNLNSILLSILTSLSEFVLFFVNSAGDPLKEIAALYRHGVISYTYRCTPVMYVKIYTLISILLNNNNYPMNN